MATKWDCPSTDRGWLFDGKTCLGHYLDYSQHWPQEKIEREGGTVHAVTCEPREARVFATVEAARAWIEATTTNQPSLFGEVG